jgi:linoleoyl-CoA desaturase
MPAQRNRVVAWLAGGLNFQIEHRLFPRIGHLKYPVILNLVEETWRRLRHGRR